MEINLSIYVVVMIYFWCYVFFFFFQAEDGIRDVAVTGVQTCALPISPAGVRDDPQLVGEPLFHWRGQRIAVARPRSRAREVDEQVIVGGELRRPGKLGQEVALLEVELAQLGDARGLG